MAKDTFIHRIKRKYFTKSLRHAIIANSLIFLLLLLLFNVFSIGLLRVLLSEKMDIRLKHESYRLKSTIEVMGDSLVFISLTEIMEPDFKDSTEHPFMLQIFNTNHDLLYESVNHRYFPRINYYYPDNLTGPLFTTVPGDNTEFRMMLDTINDRQGNVRAILQLAVFTDDIFETSEDFININLAVLPLFLILIIILSIYLARRTFAPLEEIITVAATISASNISKRVTYEAENEDILGRLRDTLNELLGRLDFQINQISQFTDNASHQLMNPLTALKSELEYILKKKELSESQLQTVKMLSVQTDKMIEIIRSLLVISRSHKNLSGSRSVINFSKVLKEFVQTMYPDVEFDSDENIYVKGSEEYIRIVAENLIENAIKYSDNNSGCIRVSLRKNNQFSELSVSDNGYGIPDNEKDKIFERFYRSDEAEKMGIKGFGLGLSLVKTIITLAGGTIEVRDNQPSGTVFRVRLPLVILED